MIEERYCHDSVSLGNKLFVMSYFSSNPNSEITDSFSGKFMYVESFAEIENYNDYYFKPGCRLVKKS